MQPTSPTPSTAPPAVQTVVTIPVSSRQYARDQEYADRAARRRDPDARLTAQETLAAAPQVTVVLQPTETDRRYGESHIDADGNPIYPRWECTYNGVRLSYEVGVPIQMPTYIYEQYAHSMRLPVFRKAPGEAGVVWSREIGDGVMPEPDFGR